MPLYNCEKYVAEAIKSVLNQTFKNFELVIADSSTDNSTRIVESFSDSRIVLIRNELRGVSHARNLAIRNARGQYISLLDSDDYYDPQKLAIQLCQTKETETVTYTSSDVVGISGIRTPKTREPITGDALPELLGRFQPISCYASMMFKKKDFENAGMYDEKLNLSEDFDLAIRLSMFKRFSFIDKSLYIRNRVPASLTQALGRGNPLPFKTNLQIVGSYFSQPKVRNRLSLEQKMRVKQNMVSLARCAHDYKWLLNSFLSASMFVPVCRSFFADG